jgi:hypothetical protein
MQGINVQDILKLKVRSYAHIHPSCLTDRVQSAAIHTVSGVNMTTRRQLLKIKVRRCRIGRIYPC